MTRNVIIEFHEEYEGIHIRHLKSKNVTIVRLNPKKWEIDEWEIDEQRTSLSIFKKYEKPKLYALINDFISNFDFNEYPGYEETSLTREEFNSLSYEDKKKIWLRELFY